jgi:glycosyltransferase involved in cell wall biosynthesis
MRDTMTKSVDLSADSHRAPKTGLLVLNVLQIVWAAQQLEATIVRMLDKDRFSVFVATAPDCWEDIDWGKDQGVTVWTMKFGTSVSLRRGFARRLAAMLINLQMIPALLSLMGRMRRENIRIIHTGSSPRDALGGLVLSLLTGATLVIHWHNIFWGEYPLIWRLAFRRARLILAVSLASGRSLVDIGIPANKVQVLYNGIDVERYRFDPEGARAVREELGIAPDTTAVLLPGRLRSSKGQAELIQAVALLKERGHDVLALLVGRDDPRDLSSGGRPYRPYLEQLCGELGVADRVRFIDHRNDIPAIMSAADIVTIPSSLQEPEPFGLVVVEAMACGRPVIGTRSGGISELIDDGVSGLLVPANTSVASGLADAIERLLIDTELRRQLEVNAPKHVKAHFSQERMVQDAAQFYESLTVKRCVTTERRAHADTFI